MLTGHTKEVTAVAWCPTELAKIATCSDNNDLRLWRVVRGKRTPGEIAGTCESYSERGTDILHTVVEPPYSGHSVKHPSLLIN